MMRRMDTLLMIEDDHRLAHMVSAYLEQSGFAVHHAATAEEGLTHLQTSATPVALVLLDLMLPDADGLDVCRRIRNLGGTRGNTPVLMLTAKGDPMDRIVGLEVGADDYLPKPFEPRELLARLRAILRRAPGASTSNAGGHARGDVLTFGRLEIDRGAREVRVDGAARELTSYQFTLLAALAGHSGRVLSREAIMDLVKGEALEAFDRSIDVQISRIRQAIEDDPKKPRRIITVRGSGYVFAKAQP